MLSVLWALVGVPLDSTLRQGVLSLLQPAPGLTCVQEGARKGAMNRLPRRDNKKRSACRKPAKPHRHSFSGQLDGHTLALDKTHRKGSLGRHPFWAIRIGCYRQWTLTWSGSTGHESSRRARSQLPRNEATSTSVPRPSLPQQVQPPHQPCRTQRAGLKCAIRSTGFLPSSTTSPTNPPTHPS